jgi:serine/threonine-protein kinase HipA
VTLRELRVSLHVGASPVVVGTLAEDDGAVYFEYDAEFLGSGLSLSPYALPVRAGLQRHRRKPGVPIPGVFSDSRPDGWGLRLLHHAFAAAGRPRARVTALDELAFLGDRAMGALTYAPSTGPDVLFEAVELGHLAEQARAVYAGDIDEVLPALLRAGGSPGGARPKALIGRSADQTCVGEGPLPAGYEPWLVKFERPEDDRECAAREAVWLTLAAEAGISVPQHETIRLGGAGTALATRRFDRAPRRHLLSAAGALDVDFRTAVVDYLDLGKLTLFLSNGDLDQVAELVRRAVFNVVMRNDDDHLKNHAWLYDGASWALSPAYDLTWSPLPERSTPVLGAVGDISRSTLLALGTRLGIPDRRMERILDDVLTAASQVRNRLTERGCVGPVSRAAADSVEIALRRTG